MILKDQLEFKYLNNIDSMKRATEICEKANPKFIDINYVVAVL